MSNRTEDAPGLPPLRLPGDFNYVAAFLTLDCTLGCSYCITEFGAPGGRHEIISGARWVRGLNRLRLNPDLPVTLQGGEPTLHPDFYEIIDGLRDDLNIDVLTNLQFDIEPFMDRIPPDRIRRDSPYASIRVSYHPERTSLDAVKGKVLTLMARGYSVGIWGVRHPAHVEEIERARGECTAEGIDFREKDFLGHHEDRLHGTYKYPEAVSLRQGPKVRCRTTELIVGPSGSVYRCHGDMYGGRAPVGRIDDPAFVVDDAYRPCDAFGFCNPCDVKVKTNRFQCFGHTSVDIQGLDSPSTTGEGNDDGETTDAGRGGERDGERDGNDGR